MSPSSTKRPIPTSAHTFPDFPGVVTTGPTLGEAIKKAGQALALHAKGKFAARQAPSRASGLSQILADPAYRTDVRALVPLELPEITTSARDRSRRYLGHRDRLHHRRHHENLGHGTSTSSGSPPSSSRSWRLRPSRSDRQPSIKLIVVHTSPDRLSLFRPQKRDQPDRGSNAGLLSRRHYATSGEASGAPTRAHFASARSSGSQAAKRQSGADWRCHGQSRRSTANCAGLRPARGILQPAPALATAIWGRRYRCNSMLAPGLRRIKGVGSQACQHGRCRGRRQPTVVQKMDEN
jgi:predicted RNase H-like HicB family nuclease